MSARVLMLLFFLTAFTSANSQGFDFGLQSGIGSYSMKGLKNINQSLKEGLPFDSKLADNFPAYFYYRPSMIIRYTNFSLGVIYSFQSTGSRVSAKDYSAEYRFDMKVKSDSPAIYFDIRIKDRGKFTLNFYSIIGPAFSNLEIKEYFKVADTVLSNSNLKLKALNYCFEPGINLHLPVKRISFELSLGYLIGFGDEAFYKGNDKNNMLIDPKNQDTVRPDWNGIRLGISLFL